MLYFRHKTFLLKTRYYMKISVIKISDYKLFRRHKNILKKFMDCGRLVTYCSIGRVLIKFINKLKRTCFSTNLDINLSSGCANIKKP